MKTSALSLSAFALLGLISTGCTSLYNSQRHEAGSVVQFLYPDTSQPFIQPTIPTLRLPLRVGVAFVPAAMHRDIRYSASSTIPESQKAELLRRVTIAFKALPFVQSIEAIPTTYLRPGGGFENLDQLRAMMGIDVVALVAYDQNQATSDTAWSLSYWTIVGAYMVPAQKNDTHTLMEAVVYDIASRSLLFRAPGTSAIKGHSTLVNTREQMQADSVRGMAAASTEMITSLEQELALFRVRAREEPQSVRIEHKPGYSGAGSMDGWFVGALCVLLGINEWRRRRLSFSSR